MEEKKLEEMYQMVQDNNRMLRAMRRAAFIGNIIQIVWWVFILLVLPYFTWLFLQPYLNSVLGAYDQVQTQAGAVGSQVTSLKDIFNQFGGGAGQ